VFGLKLYQSYSTPDGLPSPGWVIYPSEPFQRYRNLNFDCANATTMTPATLQAILDRCVDQKKVFGASFAVQKADQFWVGGAGNRTADAPFFIASTTKLFTTALILKLREAQKLTLDDPITQHLENNITHRLHVYKNADYSHRITIKHLLAHQSGLADYFQGKQAKGQTLLGMISKGVDQAWSFEQTIELTRSMPAQFAPGTPGKAFYSDTNFQLLGRIIENLSGKPYHQCIDEAIIGPLRLSKTYLYHDINDTRPGALYYQNKPLSIPKAMASFGPDGGIVSTAESLLRFLHGFLNGQLFPVAYLKELQQWQRIFFPMESGIGIHRFKLPWIFNPLGSVPEFIGHSGLSGALTFCAPKTGVYIAGTVNQVAYNDLSFRTMIKLAQTAAKVQ